MDLKKNIQKHRAELDRIEMPDKAKIWAKIQVDLSDSVEHRPLEKPHKGRRFTLWSLGVAASVALMLGIGLGYWMKVDTDSTDGFNLADYAPELEQQEQAYQQLVASKMSELNIKNIDKAAFAEIFEELENLDQEYDNWTKDVPQYIHEQELIEFLSRHYEQKIRILEILSKEIEKKANYDEKAVNI